MSVSRPLPPAPSLEFERREAKALLKALRAADASALQRAAVTLDAAATAHPAQVKLADAQRVIAREYGFVSWPRLVRYFEDLARQREPSTTATGIRRGVSPPDWLEAHVERFMHGVAARDPEVARLFSAWVPRFYGRPHSVVFANAVTTDEARLVVARSEGFASWTALLDASAASERWRRANPWAVPMWHEPMCAVQAGDLAALERAVSADPALLSMQGEWGEVRQFLLVAALRDPDDRPPRGLASPNASARDAIVRWLVARGADLHAALGPMMLAHPFGRMSAERLQWLLALGANPDGVAPNGLSVLEYALLRDWDPEAVDLLAARIAPSTRRDALWIAAGLGDVPGVLRWLDAKGRPLAAVRRDRPDFSAVAPRRAFPLSVEPSDAELLQEAFWVAARLERTAVMRALIAKGVDVNGRFAEIPYLVIAVSEHKPRIVEALLACGADADARDWREQTSARDLARSRWLESPSPATRRIAALLGQDPDALLAARDATPVPAPSVSRHLDATLGLATDDALRMGADTVELEHLFVGLLRAEHGNPVQLVRWSFGPQLRAFVSAWRDRLLPHDERLDVAALPRSAAVEAALREASANAWAARRREVSARDLLAVLVAEDDRPVARLLRDAGADLGRLRVAIAD